MPDFSSILQSPEIRAIVQENLLERCFHDALFPRMLFRSEVTAVEWPMGVGDSMLFSAPGLIATDARPLIPGQDPKPVTYPLEQWYAQLQTYGTPIDTHMPTSNAAIANLFLRNGQQLGLQAGQTLNRIVRNRLYGAALSGQTVATSATSTSNLLPVARLNGFTRARTSTGTGTNSVRFETVSTNNPLAVTIYDNGSEVANTVVGYTATTAGDEYGPGVLTLGTNVTSVAARGYIYSSDCSYIVRSGGSKSVAGLSSATLPTLADIRTAVARLRMQNVPEHPDMRFHAHIDPLSEAKLYADTEMQRLNTALPDYYIYRAFAIGEVLGTIFVRNNECPVAATVVGGTTASYDARDPFPGELFNTGVSTGDPVHRILFTGQGGIMEYYQNYENVVTEAGITGKLADPKIVNNGIEIFSDRIKLVIRAPLNRLQDEVSTMWAFRGDWPFRTDATTGDAARYKRVVCIEHGE